MHTSASYKTTCSTWLHTRRCYGACLRPSQRAGEQVTRSCVRSARRIWAALTGDEQLNYFADLIAVGVTMFSVAFLQPGLSEFQKWFGV